MHSLFVRLPESDFAALSERAASAGLNLSEYCRRLLASHVGHDVTVIRRGPVPRVFGQTSKEESTE